MGRTLAPAAGCWPVHPPPRSPVSTLDPQGCADSVHGPAVSGSEAAGFTPAEQASPWVSSRPIAAGSVWNSVPWVRPELRSGRESHMASPWEVLPSTALGGDRPGLQGGGRGSGGVALRADPEREDGVRLGSWGKPLPGVRPGPPALAPSWGGCGGGWAAPHLPSLWRPHCAALGFVTFLPSRSPSPRGSPPSAPGFACFPESPPFRGSGVLYKQPDPLPPPRARVHPRPEKEGRGRPGRFCGGPDPVPDADETLGLEVQGPERVLGTSLVQTGFYWSPAREACATGQGEGAL